MNFCIHCVNALQRATSFPRALWVLIFMTPLCVNALQRATSFPLEGGSIMRTKLKSVNALQRATSFPQYPFKNSLFMLVCEHVFAGICLKILITRFFRSFLGFLW